MEETLKLLVVDDEPDNLDLLYRTFRRDFVVLKATSGAEALQLLANEGEMAIIISDQRMPQMTGTEFLGQTVERFPDTIRMVLTGYTDVDDLVSAINSGKVFKYITKPWNPAKLRETVAQAAETYRVLKQRTRVLSRALAQESLSNEIMTAVRGSLDYDSTLQRVVKALGQAFSADLAILYPVEVLSGDREIQDFLIYRPDSCLGNPTEPSLGALEAIADTSGENLSSHTLNLTLNTDSLNHPAAIDATPRCLLFDDVENLPPLHSSLEIISEPIDISGTVTTRIVVPFLEKGKPIATVCLYKQTKRKKWADNAVELLKNVAEQVALAISHAKLYQHIHRQSTQIRAELDVARKIQSNLLHQKLPDIAGIDIQARCQPAREVGGDFFEVFMHPKGDIWLSVGDVSGKGVPAALFMVSAISVLRRELAQEQSPSPDKVMHNLNHSLSNDLMSNNCFITMALIRYSPAEQRLVYANAGHVYPVVWSHRNLVNRRDYTPDSPAVVPTYLDVRGVPLGILPHWRAAAGEMSLAEGDVVLLTSDGITEATVPTERGGNGSCSMLNQEGLWEFLQQQPAKLDLDRLLSYIHLSEGEQEDDQTILSLEVTSC